ncbi:MAG TPA: NYN domain-containing protein [Leptolyngbya sp.]|jgi:uncharacterized protein (TIGR00288 family)|nr:NYN domain-containing protein [Leptolyngbya sp.]
MSEKVAIFLDVENLSGWLKSEGGNILLKESDALGQVVIRRAYGDFSNAAVSSRQEDLTNLGFEFVHVYHPVKGKNAADIQIVVDVMDVVAQSPDVRWFVLATSDADFSPLFRRLKALGKNVVGIGRESVLSRVVKNSCDRFIYVTEQTIPAKTKKTETPYDRAVKTLGCAIVKLPTPTTLPLLKAEMLKLDSTFDHGKLGHKQFLKFLKSTTGIVKLELRKNQWFVCPAAKVLNLVSLNATAEASTKKAV